MNDEILDRESTWTVQVDGRKFEIASNMSRQRVAAKGWPEAGPLSLAPSRCQAGSDQGL